MKLQNDILFGGERGGGFFVEYFYFFKNRKSGIRLETLNLFWNEGFKLQRSN